MCDRNERNSWAPKVTTYHSNSRRLRPTPRVQRPKTEYPMTACPVPLIPYPPKIYVPPWGSTKRTKSATKTCPPGKLPPAPPETEPLPSPKRIDPPPSPPKRIEPICRYPETRTAPPIISPVVAEQCSLDNCPLAPMLCTSKPPPCSPPIPPKIPKASIFKKPGLLKTVALTSAAFLGSYVLYQTVLKDFFSPPECGCGCAKYRKRN